MSNKSRIDHRQKKKKRKKRVLFFLLVPTIVLLVGVAIWATYLHEKAEQAVSDAYVDDGRAKSDLRDEIVDPNVDNVSILIIGVDENDHRNNAGDARSDALMLATLNKEEHSVKLLSIPRDSLVFIPEIGYEDKINHAHAYGGPKATVETVENLLDIPVDYWARLNFHAFVEVVDSLNGITVEVPYEFKESNSMDKRDAIHLMPGEQVLNGEEALALARTRKQDNDIQRGKRQQDIIKAIVKKGASVNSILKYDNVIEAVGDNMATNMSFKEMKSFISYGTKGDGLDIDSHTLDGVDYWPANTYYWKVDEVALSETKALLQNHLELDDKSFTNSSNTNNHENEERASGIED